ncbi:MAG: hypothetical protein FJ096_11115 [Deltaproteobacteria bacterium]|nr:hypothetical protein [Deltaproteobacteria bacterium]
MIGRSFAKIAALAVGAWVMPGCAEPAAPPACRVGADCASGTCLTDGRCLPSDGDASAGTAGPGGGATGAGGGMACTPNGDAVLERDEIVLGPGLAATYRVARNVPVDTGGEALADGRFAWDLSGALAGDIDEAIATTTLEGAWFASSYPGASYVAPLTKDALLGEVVGVFETRPDALVLRGVASIASGATATRVAHAPGATVLAFPLAVGATWKSTSTVSGQALGLPTLYSETYDAKVDRAGTLKTPFGPFEVMRVRTTLTRVVGALPTVTRSFAFVAPCFGAVATITAKAGELAEEFSLAAEVKRLAP